MEAVTRSAARGSDQAGTHWQEAVDFNYCLEVVGWVRMVMFRAPAMDTSRHGHQAQVEVANMRGVQVRLDWVWLGRVGSGKCLPCSGCVDVPYIILLLLLLLLRHERYCYCC